MRRRELLRELLLGLAAGVHAPAFAKIAVDGSRRRIDLSHNGRAYTATVDIPGGQPPADGWPLILVLDGNAYFETMVSAVRSQARFPDWTGMPETVVVGIDQAGGKLFGSARTFDYTPVPLKSPGSAEAVGGGADLFHTFLMQQVLPAVSALSPVDPARRMLFGHSLGGLFVLHTLFRHGEGFYGYGASSPSIWWADKAILQDLALFLEAQPRTAKRLLISAGEWEARLSPYAEIAPDRSEREKSLQDAAMVQNAATMAEALGKVHGLAVRYDFHPNQDHISVPFAAIPLAARFIFGRAL